MSLPKPCAHPGCPAIVKGRRFCEAHQRQAWREQDRQRPSYRSRRPKDWEARRAAVLARDPICTICREAPSDTVDHIRDRGKTRGSEVVPGLDDLTNLRGVCRSCHSRRTARDHLAGKDWR